MKETSYHDYVFKDGHFVGQFEAMYAKCGETPWNQEETSRAIFSELDVSVLRSLHERHRFQRVADLACGLGHLTHRFASEALISPKCEVTGYDVSPSAIRSCRLRFPGLRFETIDITEPPPDKLRNHFDLAIVGNCLWYLIESLDAFLEGINMLTSRFFYFFNSFPTEKPFHGDHLFPHARTVVDRFISNGNWNNAYECIERDAAYEGREYLHLLLEKNNQSS